MHVFSLFLWSADKLILDSIVRRNDWFWLNMAAQKNPEHGKKILFPWTQWTRSCTGKNFFWKNLESGGRSRSHMEDEGRPHQSRQDAQHAPHRKPTAGVATHIRKEIETGAASREPRIRPATGSWNLQHLAWKTSWVRGHGARGAGANWGTALKCSRADPPTPGPRTEAALNSSSLPGKKPIR